MRENVLPWRKVRISRSWGLECLASPKLEKVLERFVDLGKVILERSVGLGGSGKVACCFRISSGAT